MLGLGSSMSDLPSRETLESAICTIMAGSNLSELSSKTVRKSLESMLEIDLKPHKEYIDELLMGQVDAAHASAAASAAPAEAAAIAPREPTAAEIAAAEETLRLKKVIKRIGMENKTKFIKKAGVAPDEYNAKLAEAIVKAVGSTDPSDDAIEAYAAEQARPAQHLAHDSSLRSLASCGNLKSSCSP